jgi:hypothetical protein
MTAERDFRMCLGQWRFLIKALGHCPKPFDRTSKGPKQRIVGRLCKTAFGSVGRLTQTPYKPLPPQAQATDVFLAVNFKPEHHRHRFTIVPLH